MQVADPCPAWICLAASALAVATLTMHVTARKILARWRAVAAPGTIMPLNRLGKTRQLR
jgi:hypothetical protein